MRELGNVSNDLKRFYKEFRSQTSYFPQHHTSVQNRNAKINRNNDQIRLQNTDE